MCGAGHGDAHGVGALSGGSAGLGRSRIDWKRTPLQLFGIVAFSDGKPDSTPAGVYHRAGLRPDPLARAGALSAPGHHSIGQRWPKMMRLLFQPRSRAPPRRNRYPAGRLMAYFSSSALLRLRFFSSASGPKPSRRKM